MERRFGRSPITMHACWKNLPTLSVIVLAFAQGGCSDSPGVGKLPATGGSGGNESAEGGGGGQSNGGQSNGGQSNGGQSNGGQSSSSRPTVGKCTVLPQDNAWNIDVSKLPVHKNSANFINSIGRDGHLHPDFGTEWEGAPIGIPYEVVDGIKKVTITFNEFADESDPGPYPIPKDAAIEGGPNGEDDRHVLVIDESDCKLYELYRAFPQNDGSWEADSGAVWDLTTNAGRGSKVPVPAAGKQGWTSADAAGLAIFPGLARYDEIVEKGELLHALRFTVSESQAKWVWPATHYASSNTDSNLPPMGLRVRMRADYDCSSYSDEVQVLCRGLKRFGMIVADNGSDWYVSGAPDPRWNDDHLNDFKTIPGSAFEVVDTSSLE
jgi:hypothetical protein